MEPFLSQILIWPPNFAPQGWAFCAGQLIPISQNTALFSLIGTFYGGDGQTTFALPNLQGRVPIGAGQARLLQLVAICFRTIKSWSGFADDLWWRSSKCSANNDILKFFLLLKY